MISARPRTEQGTEHRRLRPSRGLLSQPAQEFIALTGQGHDRACRQMLAVEPIQERATRWLPDDDPLIGETLQRSPDTSGRLPEVAVATTDSRPGGVGRPSTPTRAAQRH